MHSYTSFVSVMSWQLLGFELSTDFPPASFFAVASFSGASLAGVELGGVNSLSVLKIEFVTIWRQGKNEVMSSSSTCVPCPNRKCSSASVVASSCPAAANAVLAA